MFVVINLFALWLIVGIPTTVGLWCEYVHNIEIGFWLLVGILLPISITACFILLLLCDIAESIRRRSK